MLRNVVEPVGRTASPLQHVSLSAGNEGYGLHLHPIPTRLAHVMPQDTDPFSSNRKPRARMGAKHGSITRLFVRNSAHGPPRPLNGMPAMEIRWQSSREG